MTTPFDIVRDTFTRTVADDWGRADNGTDYEILTSNAVDFDVSGGRGTIVHPIVVGGNHRITVPGNYKNVSGYFEIRINELAVGSAVVADMLLRWVDDNNYVAARIEFSTAPNAVAVIYKVVAGVVTTMQTVIVNAYTTNSPWWFRYQIIDSTLNTKLWASAGIEPPTWTTTGSVSDILNPGRVILQTRRELGNTNTAGLTLSFEDFEITSTLPAITILPQFLQDYEFKFGQEDSSLVLNNGAAAALPGAPIWDVQKVTGLDLPDVKVSDKEFDGIDGGVVEASNISMRTIRLEGVLYAHQDDSLEDYLDRLKANYAPVPRQVNGEFFDPSQKPFFIKPPGLPERFIFAKPISLKYDWDTSRRFNSTPFQIILQAQVPTQFSPELHIVTSALSGNIGTEHRLQVYNAGNYHGYAIVRFYQIGNFPDVHIKHVEQNVELSMFLGQDASVANRPVEINMRQRTVFVIDNPPVNFRKDTVAEGWWRLQPGMNTIAVRTDVSNSGRVELLWRDEWF